MVTDGDRAKGREIRQRIHQTLGWPLQDELIAAALAEEREKARVPFVALAEDLDRLAENTEAQVVDDDRSEYRADQLGLAIGYTRSARLIRRVAEEG